MARQSLEEKAEKTLRDTDAYRVPVPIHLVAQRLNLTLEAATLGDKVSGLLVVQGDRARIGYNAAHARVRHLMPRTLLREEIRHQDLDLDDGEVIELLAKRFQVSSSAMSNRLTNLKLFF